MKKEQCKLVSIIVPIFNTESYLVKCIESILAQDYQNFELLLVNDGSTDASGSICDEYSYIDKRIKVLHKDNGGVSSARNIGLKMAQGNYVLFIDSDDWIESDTISYLLMIITTTNADCSICDFCNKNIPLQSFYQDSFKIQNFDMRSGIENALIPKGYSWSTCNKMFKKSLINTNSISFDESISIGEDLVFTISYLLHCANIAYGPKPKYHYRWRETSAINEAFNPKKLSAIKAYSKVERILSGNDLGLCELFNSVFLSALVELLIEAQASEAEEKHIVKIREYIKRFSKGCYSNTYISYKLKIYIKLILINPSLFKFIRKRGMQTKNLKYKI